MASYTGSLQYEDSTSCALYRFLLPPRRQFNFAPLFVVERNFFVLSKKSSSAFFLVDFLHPSTHPSSPQRPLHRANVVSQESSFFVKFSVSSSSYSPILDRLSIHPRLLVFINPSFCSLGEYVSRPLLRENLFPLFSVLQKKPSSISSMFCQSLRTSFYPSNSQSALFSVVRFLSPISFRSVSFPSFFLAVSTLYSSRYPQCLLYNIVDTL